MERSRVIDAWQLEEARRNVLRILETRFPGDLPPDVVQSMSKLKDPAQVPDWIEAAVHARDVEAFRQAVQR
jgi:hypothetical protein